jgi:hypothetical protein
MNSLVLYCCVLCLLETLWTCFGSLLCRSTTFVNPGILRRLIDPIVRPNFQFSASNPANSSSTHTMPDKPCVRVAVIGSGLAGLSTAHILSTQPSNRFSVTLYEKAASVGMDSGSVDLKCPCPTCSGNLESEHKHAPTRRIDVPMRGFYPSWYPSVVSLYDYLGVPYEAVGTGCSFSLRTESAGGLTRVG